MSEYEMVMPFVTVTSKGGPHDDNSYVAGYAMGTLNAELRVGMMIGADISRDVAQENVEQAELLAMRHGYVSEQTPSSEDGWVLMEFSPGMRGGLS